MPLESKPVPELEAGDIVLAPTQHGAVLRLVNLNLEGDWGPSWTGVTQNNTLAQVDFPRGGEAFVVV